MFPSSLPNGAKSRAGWSYSVAPATSKPRYRGARSRDFIKVMVRAADTLGMAPMMCALFLAARMRALQMVRRRDSVRSCGNAKYPSSLSLIGLCERHLTPLYAFSNYFNQSNSSVSYRLKRVERLMKEAGAAARYQTRGKALHDMLVQLLYVFTVQNSSLVFAFGNLFMF